MLHIQNKKSKQILIMSTLCIVVFLTIIPQSSFCAYSDSLKERDDRNNNVINISQIAIDKDAEQLFYDGEDSQRRGEAFTQLSKNARILTPLVNILPYPIIRISAQISLNIIACASESKGNKLKKEGIEKQIVANNKHSSGNIVKSSIYNKELINLSDDHLNSINKNIIQGSIFE